MRPNCQKRQVLVTQKAARCSDTWGMGDFKDRDLAPHCALLAVLTSARLQRGTAATAPQTNVPIGQNRHSRGSGNGGTAFGRLTSSPLHHQHQAVGVCVMGTCCQEQKRREEEKRFYNFST